MEGSIAAGLPAAFGRLDVSKFYDLASPKLFLACATGQTFKQVVLTLALAGQLGRLQDFARFTLQTAFVSALSDSAAAGEDRAAESLTLTFGALLIELMAPDANGVVQRVTAGFSQLLSKTIPVP